MAKIVGFPSTYTLAHHQPGSRANANDPNPPMSLGESQIVVAGIASGQAIGAAAIAGAVAAAGITSAAAFGQPTVTAVAAPVSITGVGGIASAAGFGNPRVAVPGAAPVVNTGGGVGRPWVSKLGWQILLDVPYATYPTLTPLESEAPPAHSLSGAGGIATSETVGQPGVYPIPRHAIYSAGGAKSAEAHGATVIEFVGRGEVMRRRAAAAILELLMAA